MEFPGMEETKKSEAHLSSAAAFVEGGIQEACDDACSICLEAFCDSDPLTVTSCKHEFHLQCILEWCQRSSQCPMCWQSISLKDPTSQELLDAVEKERNLRLNPPRHATIFHHPALGDLELQHLPGGTSDADLEERIIQHLAAATAMGRARHIARREGQRIRSSAHSHPRFLVFSTPNPHSVGSVSAQNGDGELTAAVGGATLSPPPTSVGEESSFGSATIHPVHADEVFASGSGSTVVAANQEGTSLNISSARHSSQNSQDKAGPSEFQSFSESLKSRFNSLSLKYKETISKGTRGWKEKWFSRDTSMAEIGSEVRREVNAGIATVSRMMERLETRDNNRANGTTSTTGIEDGSIRGSNNQQSSVAADGSPLRDGNVPTSCPTGSRQS